ncbi:MAG: acid phosphatase [Rhizobiaceae bacterium]
MRILLSILTFAFLGFSVSAQDDPLPDGFEAIETIVIVYAENRSFAHLLPEFPGAFDIASAPSFSVVQKDRNGEILPALPPVWQIGKSIPDPAYPESMPNAPFRLDEPLFSRSPNILNVGPAHRFYQNRMQINGGKNDMFAAWNDTGSLVMGNFDGEGTNLYKLAREFVLLDQFFQAAYGGSNLNHFFFSCACSPKFPDAPEHMLVALDENGDLALAQDSPKSALTGPPIWKKDGSISPDGHVVNTVQPPYQPSGIPPGKDGDPRFADVSHHPLPPLTMPTIGDRLTDKGVDWAWYAQGWDAANAWRGVIYNSNGAVNFQPHHQPYNYFANYAPGTAARERHLKDMKEFWEAVASGKLPPVSFVKPDGNDNQHPGDSTVAAGDLVIGMIVDTLRKSPQWDNMAIIITHDENGGYWDPATPPAGDRFGPGSRVPAVIVSPFARKGVVDHTIYDATSILQFISKRFDLETLAGIRTQFGDLRNAFAIGKE